MFAVKASLEMQGLLNMLKEEDCVTPCFSHGCDFGFCFYLSRQFAFSVPVSECCGQHRGELLIGMNRLNRLAVGYLQIWTPIRNV